MRRPRALDLFCGGGGAAVGLHRAGFDVVGVDIRSQPHYPFSFIHADAMTFPLDGFDFIWASPPCQAFSTATRDKAKHADLVDPIRQRLAATGALTCIENVPGAPLVNPIMLCGAMFGLGVLRHRLFELSWFVMQPGHPDHGGSVLTGQYVTVAGNSSGVGSYTMRRREELGLPRILETDRGIARRKVAMGIDWLPGRALSQAIPPAYSEWIGHRALEQLHRGSR